MKVLNFFQVFICLVIILLLPSDLEGFKFGFGLGDDDSEENRKDSEEAKERNAAKRPKVEKKFKFHKIERIYLDDYIEENEDTNGDGDGDGDDKAKMSSAAETSQTNEDEEFQFEKARKAIKDKRPKDSKRSSKNSKKVKSSKSRDTDDDDDGNGNESKDSKSFLSSIFESLFGDEEEEDEESSKLKGSNGKSNGLIDWLIWLGEKTGRLKPPPPPPSEQKESWLSYLDRWPFNTLFPIGKQVKPIRIPPRKNGNNRRHSTDQDDDSNENDDQIQPMSEDRFETLLHSLPTFVVNPKQVADTECRQQLQIFQRQLRGHKLWTMQMLDASGKIASGILRGNINQFGDFDMCTQVKTLVKVTPEVPVRIRGKYCLAHIETQTDDPGLKVPVHLAHGRGLWNSHLGNPGHFVPRYAVANWGICVPHSCSAKIVEDMIEHNLHLFNTTGVDFHVEVQESDCVTRKPFKFTRLMKKDRDFATGFLCLVGLSVLVALTIVHDYWSQMGSILLTLKEKLKRKSSVSEKLENEAEEESQEPKEETAVEEKDPAAVDEEMVAENTEEQKATEAMPLKVLAKEIFLAFSPKRTLRELLSTENLDVEFPIFHVLKLVATLMLYMCLKYLMIGHLPIKNRDTLVRSVDHQLSIVFRMPIIYADILLLIAGFLSAYQLSAEMIEKSSIQLLKRLASKMLRYLPTIFVVLCVQTWILPNLESAPLWSNLIGENARLCSDNMWRNFLNVQNVIDFEETCSPSTIQLALEAQLFILGPLIVWLYYTDADAGFFVYGAIHGLSVAIRYARTNQEHLSMTVFHGMNVSKFYRSANLLYSSPLSRATPYLIGIGAGLLYRTQQGVMEISKSLTPFGWLTAIFSLVWCFWSPSDGMQTDYIYSSKEAASYAAWCPLVMGLALSWFIFMFPKDESSLIRFFAKSRPLVFLSRLAFPMQMVAFVVVLKNTAKVKETMNYNVGHLINPQEIGEIVFYALILTFLIDMPSRIIRHLIVDRLFIERPPSAESEETLDEQGANETAENEGNENPSEQDGTKPEDAAEGVWASDPEEEEKKYLARRRSSVIISEDSVKKEEPEQEQEEEEETEEEEEIKEADEVKKRPATPPPPAPPEEEKTYRWRRRPMNED